MVVRKNPPYIRGAVSLKKNALLHFFITSYPNCNSGWLIAPMSLQIALSSTCVYIAKLVCGLVARHFNCRELETLPAWHYCASSRHLFSPVRCTSNVSGARCLTASVISHTVIHVPKARVQLIRLVICNICQVIVSLNFCLQNPKSR